MKIIDKKILAQSEKVRIVLLKIKNKLIADKFLPGQFVIVMVSKQGERIPLTIVDADKKNGVIVIVFQEIGFTTKLLGKLNIGDSLYTIVGPLGNATEIKKYENVIMVAGGVGIAEMFPVARAFKEAGNKLVNIIGVRTKELLIFEKEISKISNKMFITTDDGSYGEQGFTTDILSRLLSKGLACDLVYTVGPIPMMRRVAEITKSFKIKTVASLNALMVDGSGMCGSCRVRVGGEVKFSCIDGPEFDAHLVNWEEFDKRSRVYFEKEHICKRLIYG